MSGTRLYILLFGTLRRQLIFGVAVVHAVLMTLFICDMAGRQRALILDRQTEYATALANALATSSAGWLSADDISGMQELADAQHHYPDLDYAILLNNQGQVLAHTDRSRIGLYVQDLPSEARVTVLSRSSALVDVVVPAMLAQRHVGWARVGIGQRLAAQKLKEITLCGILYAAVAILAGSFLALLLGRRITRRLDSIQSVMDEVRAGHHQARSHLTGGDEAATLANNFNMMLEMLEQRQREVTQSEVQSRSLVRNIHTAVIVHGPKTEVLVSNSFAQMLLGLTEEQMRGKEAIDPTWSFLREDGTMMPVEEYPVSQVAASRQPLRGFVIGIKRPDLATVLWALVNANPVFDDEGEMSQVLVSFVDITERRQAEAALRESDQQVRLLNELQELLLSPYSLEQKLKLVTEALVRIVGADFARIWTIKPGDRCAAGCIHAQVTEGPHVCRFRDRCLHLMASSGRYTHTNGGHSRVPFGCYKIGSLAGGEHIKFVTNDVTNDPRIHDHAWAKELGLVSFAGYRLVDAGGNPLGVLALFSQHPISREEDSHLEGIAKATSLVLCSARAEEEIAWNLAVNEALSSLFIPIVTAGTDIEQIAHIILEKSRQLTGSAHGVAGEIDPSNGDLVTHTLTRMMQTECKVAEEGGRKTRFPRGADGLYHGLWGHALNTREPFYTHEAVTHRASVGIPPGHMAIENYLSVPVPVGGEPEGLIALANSARPFTDRDVAAVKRIAEFYLLAIQRKRAEQKIRQLAAIMESSDDAIVGKTLDGIITSWNKGAEKIFGYAESEVVGKSIDMLLPPGLEGDVQQLLGRTRSEEHVEHYETVRRRKDGRHIQMSLTVSPICGPHGEVVAASVIGRDITVRRLAEDQLRRSERGLAEAQRIAHLGNWELDLEKNALTWSDEIYRIFEVDPKHFEASYEAFLNTIHPEDRDAVNKAYTDSVRDKLPYNIVHRLQMPDGRIKSVHESGVTYYGENGRPARSVGTVHDITERKRADEERLANLRHFESLDRINRAIQGARDIEQMMSDVLSVVISIFACDRAFLLYPCDPNAASWQIPMDCSRSEYPCVLDRGAEVPMDTAVAWQLRALLETDRPVQFTGSEPRLADETRNDFDFQSSMAMAVYPKLGKPWQLGLHQCSHRRNWTAEEERLFLEIGRRIGDALSTLLSHRDLQASEAQLRGLTEELDHRVTARTVQLETANKELEAFAHSVSHDLRGPLRGIDGFSQALLEDYSEVLDEEGKRFLVRIRGGAQRMGQLIDDLLSLSHITRREMHLDEVSLSNLALEVAAELAAREPQRRVSFIIAPNVTVTGDPRFLLIVLENLLGNAWKFTSRLLEAKIEFGVTQKDRLSVYFVRDNGVGFDMEYVGRLFVVFQRLHAADEFPGTGIGLATVQRIIQRHGGRVWAEGHVNQGATFYFTLP